MAYNISKDTNKQADFYDKAEDKGHLKMKGSRTWLVTSFQAVGLILHLFHSHYLMQAAVLMMSFPSGRQGGEKTRMVSAEQ